MGGGSLTRQIEQDNPVSDSSPHIANIGKMVEEMENKIRNLLYEIYFGKTRDIVNGLRSVQALSDSKQQEDLRKVMMKDFAKKNVTKAEIRFFPFFRRLPVMMHIPKKKRAREKEKLN